MAAIVDATRYGVKSSVCALAQPGLTFCKDAEEVPPPARVHRNEKGRRAPAPLSTAVGRGWGWGFSRAKLLRDGRPLLITSGLGSASSAWCRWLPCRNRPCQMILSEFG